MRRKPSPTSVHVAPIGTSGAFRQRVIYDDGPGKTINSTEVLRVVGDQWIESSGSPEGGDAEGRTTHRIASRRQTADGVVLVLRGRGMDDNKPVEFRYTVTLRSGESRRLKEFRQPGKPWAYRHQYRFRRNTPTP